MNFPAQNVSRAEVGDPDTGYLMQEITPYLNNLDIYHAHEKTKTSGLGQWQSWEFFK